MVNEMKDETSLKKNIGYVYDSHMRNKDKIGSHLMFMAQNTTM